MHGEKNDRGAIKAPPPMGLGLSFMLSFLIPLFFFLGLIPISFPLFVLDSSAVYIQKEVNVGAITYINPCYVHIKMFQK